VWRQSESVPREPEPAPNPALDRYRFGPAQVHRDGTPIGYLSTTVTVVWAERGRGRRRQLVNPQEIVVWLLQADPDSGLFADDSDHYTDGWDVDGDVLEDITRDEFGWSPGLIFDLSWVDPVEEPTEWRTHYEREWAAGFRAPGD
jgi:hypothetical protein